MPLRSTFTIGLCFGSRMRSEVNSHHNPAKIRKTMLVKKIRCLGGGPIVKCGRH